MKKCNLTAMPFKSIYEHMAPHSLLTRGEAADLLTLKKSTLAAWASKGIGPAPTKIGSSIRYRLDGLVKFIEDNTMPR